MAIDCAEGGSISLKVSCFPSRGLERKSINKLEISFVEGGISVKDSGRIGIESQVCQTAINVYLSRNKGTLFCISCRLKFILIFFFLLKYRVCVVAY